MTAVEARLPDGTTLRFPEGTADDVVDRTVKAHLAGGGLVGAPGTTQARFMHSPTANAAAEAMMQGAEPVGLGGEIAHGYNSIVKGLGQLLLRGASGIAPESYKPGIDAFSKDFDAKVAGDETNYQQRRVAAGDASPKFDVGRLLGGAAAVGPLTALLPAAGGPITGALVGATGGALGGALEPVTSGADASFGKQKLGQIGTGAAGGAAIGGGLGAVGSVIGPRLPPSTVALRGAGINQTPGQTVGPNAARFESAMESLPILGDSIRNAKGRNLESFNRGLVNQTLGQIGEELPANVQTGRAAINHMIERTSAAYDDVLPRITGQVDQPFLGDMQTAWQQASMLPQARRDQFTQIVQDRLMRRINPATGEIPGVEIQAARGDIARLARDYRASADGDQRILGRALDEVSGSLMGLAERANPQLAARVRDINSAYAMQLRLEDAAGRAGTTIRDGVFTPAQFDAAVRGMANTNRQYARGQALMQDMATSGVQGLGERLPNSGTTDRQMAASMLNPLNWPAGIGLGIASIPYTRWGQAGVNAAIAGGNGVRTPIGQGLRNGVPLAGGVGGGLLGGQLPLPLLP